MTQNNKGEVALTPIQKRNLQLKKLIQSDDIQGRIKELISDPNKVAKFTAVLINVALDDDLYSCSQQSIIKSGLQAAELDLPLNKNMGLAYIVKYKADAEFQIGYKGWQLLAKRAGIKLNATPIFSCDHFEFFSDGFDTVVKYIPDLDKQQDHIPNWVDDNLKGVLVSTKEDSEISHKFVSIGKIKQIAGVSPSVKNGSYSAYTNWNLEMYIGKAVKYVLSKMPMKEQVARAIEIENESDKKRIQDNNVKTGEKANIIDAEFTDLKVSGEQFEQCKQNIINGETTLQELCDAGFDFSSAQYDELEQIENERNGNVQS
ncbi:TPA: recombinase RecT [Pasteurella multocida]|uniref:recombinase RecT n=2 Tax=Pasteurella multocida TaxID=747 RepID=UPI0028137EB4|nr:recombinase RecT [Pasteurella multocida]HEH9621516.1 recombinase RecT [Pasteurella multocida]HEH9654371.1 recombinase RecT [Pasteurella multocida]HEH9721860.1 recombinase RecT [Pasteurella multocida]HEH9820122.1 recombinase RecT [Pasteurella multocida]